MSETVYSFAISTDTMNGALDAGALDFQIRRSPVLIMSGALMFVSQDGPDAMSVAYSDALDANDEATLNAIVAAHDGAAVPTTTLIQTAHVTSQADVTSTSWKDIGGVVTRPEVFGPLPELVARLSFAILVPGQGVELRFTERNEDASEAVLGSWTEPDSAAAWRFVELDTTTAPSPGVHEYVLQARLAVGGQNGELRSVSLSLIRVEGAP